MNAESFADYLKNPSKLYQINYQELKSLALQYPYCQNLQWLLLQKSRMDGGKDTDTVLERTAAGSIDRTLLYKKMKSIVSIQNQIDNLFIKDEVLELPNLANLRRPEPILREMPTSSPLEEPVPAFKPLDHFQSAETEDKDLDLSKLQVPPRPTELPEITPEPGIIEPLTTPEVPEQEDPTPTIPGQHPEVPNPADPEPVLPQEAAEAEPMATSVEWEIEIKPIQTSEKSINPVASSPAKMYQAPKLQIKLPSAPSPVKSKEAQAEDLAAKSVAEKEEVVSETLALILARQGHREKALRMYEQLILKIPEKSAYFAAQIQKLKQA